MAVFKPPLQANGTFAKAKKQIGILSKAMRTIQAKKTENG